MHEARTIRDVPGAMEFLHLSAKAGQDAALVQGPGGNTSIKQDGILWVKASGTQLADALTADIFLPVRLAPLLQALDRHDPACETSADFVVAGLSPRALRPSIETTLHALLPQRVVVHVHCVETLSWACREDGEARLSERLKGLNWAFVPYARPGLPLSQAMAARLSPVPSVVVLGNHGLVVAGDTVDAAAKLLTDVQRRLRRPEAQAGSANWARLDLVAEATGYQAVADPLVHALALDPFRLQAATQGSLYPDHVIFLGPAVLTLQPDESLKLLLARNDRPIAPLVLVAGAGALLPRTATPSAKAMARCLADVMARLRPGEPLRHLTATDEYALLNWDAEKYRQALSKARA